MFPSSFPMAEGPAPEELFEREILTWTDIDKLIDHLVPQFEGEFDGILIVGKGALVPGGILSEAMKIKHVLTASVYFPEEVDRKLAWPTFVQFPPDILVTDRRILVVDDIWANGRAITIVQGRLAAAGCQSETAVLHYRIKSNLFPHNGPSYYGAVTSRYIVYPWETPLIPRRTKSGTGKLPTI